MARKHKRPAFDESDSESDSTGNGFKEYLEKKSLQSSKKAKSSQAIAVAESGLPKDESGDSKRPAKLNEASSFMGDLLKSKRQREVDMLHSQSIRNRLENDLQKKSDDPDQTFITEGYKVKRKEYDQAELQAAEESDRDADAPNEEALHGGSARGLALRMLMSDVPAQKDEAVEGEDERSGKNDIKAPRTFENDVYRAEPSKVKSSDSAKNQLVESFIKLQPEEKESCIREFLRSTKTTRDIQMYNKKYHERQSLYK